jgi:hypothetical protein
VSPIASAAETAVGLRSATATPTTGRKRTTLSPILASATALRRSAGGNPQGAAGLQAASISAKRMTSDVQSSGITGLV